ncbi:MAG: isoprenyl transferase [Methylococcales bacterium]|jgi:undecaprenyl diphosphate synthase|nr:isoprenyl transferase [Methylococcales bacterium]MBT7443858.1 isoprenyl transferase [Methylococcales bacterium]
MVDPSEESTAIPSHVAIIMDGNGRWAKKKHMPRFLGHKAGVDTVRRCVEFCVKNNIKVLTLFAFSSENWRRPEKEVSLLMGLFISSLKKQIRLLHNQNIRLRIIGDKSQLPQKLQDEILRGETLTQSNTVMDLVVAANYGGQWDVTQSVKALAEEVKQGRLAPDDITEASITQNLSIQDLPNPDLFIRTGGECRISNFLLWQLAYSELYFTPVLWPDFGGAEFEDAIASFRGRERRFGHTSEQVEQGQVSNYVQG